MGQYVLNPEEYFFKMDGVVFSILNEINENFDNVNCANLCFTSMPTDVLNPNKIYGACIFQGEKQINFNMYGFVGYSPARERNGYISSQIFDNFSLYYHNTTLLVTIEPCDLIKGAESHALLTTMEQMGGKTKKELFRPIIESISLGRFYYYQDDIRIENACKKIARKISPDLEVLAGIELNK